jgi:hypothetical protein
MQKSLFAVLATSTLLVAGCSAGTGSSAGSHGESLITSACRDIVSVMTPKSGISTIAWNESDPSRSPYQTMITAARTAPNPTLHSELATFESALSSDSSNLGNAADALLHTCKELGIS